MTARTKKGYSGHKTHGADSGTAHHRLMHAHTHGSRPAGAPAAEQQESPEPPEPSIGGQPETQSESPDVPEGPPGSMDDTDEDAS